MGYFLTNYTGAVVFAGLLYIGIVGGMGVWLADKKGYSTGAWFVLCFLTGPVGLIALAGAPSRGMEASLNEIKRKLSEQPSGSASNAAPVVPLPSAKITGDTWYCKKCQTVNPSTSNSCKGCGEYR